MKSFISAFFSMVLSTSTFAGTCETSVVCGGHSVASCSAESAKANQGLYGVCGESSDGKSRFCTTLTASDSPTVFENTLICCDKNGNALTFSARDPKSVQIANVECIGWK